jgi:hypothetical protein
MDKNNTINSDESALQDFQQRLVGLEDKFKDNVNGCAHQTSAPIAKTPNYDEIRERGGFSIRALLN